MQHRYKSEGFAQPMHISRLQRLQVLGIFMICVFQDVDVIGFLRLPACVTPKQRAVLHALAEQHQLEHTSVGEGDARQLILGHSEQPLKVCAAVSCNHNILCPMNRQCKAGCVQDASNMVSANQLTNEDLCHLLDQHLHIDARSNFAAADAGSPAPIQQKSKRAVNKVCAVLAITRNIVHFRTHMGHALCRLLPQMNKTPTAT